MSRARNIKPGFYTNEDLAECSVWARYIFPGLWMMADREGRLEYRPKKIKGELLRFDEQSAEPLLEELQRWGFIEIYEVSGRKLIQILTFSKHQNPHHREAESELPPPSSPGLNTVATTPKPQADDGFQDIQSLGEPEASPGLKAEDPTCQGGQAVLIPDSLIPDSGFSDSLIPEAAQQQASTVDARENESDALPEIRSSLTAEQQATVPIVVALRAAGIPVTAANPQVLEWVRKGLTLDRVPELVGFARTRKPNGTIHPNYIDTLVDDALNPPAPKERKPRDDWFKSDQGTDRKGRELGVPPPRVGTYADYRELIWAEIRRRKEAGVEA